MKIIMSLPGTVPVSSVSSSAASSTSPAPQPQSQPSEPLLEQLAQVQQELQSTKAALSEKKEEVEQLKRKMHDLHVEVSKTHTRPISFQFNEFIIPLSESRLAFARAGPKRDEQASLCQPQNGRLCHDRPPCPPFQQEGWIDNIYIYKNQAKC